MHALHSRALEQLNRIDTNIVFDVHLMVHNPEVHCGHWCTVKKAERFLLHVETVKDFATLCGHAAQCGKTIGASINPETSMEKLEAALPAVKLAQFMTVHPGRQGNPFVPEALERATAFHAAHPEVSIMLDGGITPQTAHACAMTGAQTLVSGSYVARSADVGRALRELEAAMVQ
jgi:ribulose-phosphate 3-epimerase